MISTNNKIPKPIRSGPFFIYVERGEKGDEREEMR
jgi:hypothetical protein